MRATGIVRRMDMLGRVVIPKEIRNTLKINFGDPIEVYTEKDEIILKRYSPIFNLDGAAKSVVTSLKKLTGHSAFITDKDVFVSGDGEKTESIIGKNISSELEKLISEKKNVIVNFSDGLGAVPLCGGEQVFFNQLFVPIVFENEGIGLVILCDEQKERNISPSDVQLATLGAEFIAANV